MRAGRDNGILCDPGGEVIAVNLGADHVAESQTLWDELDECARGLKRLGSEISYNEGWSDAIRAAVRTCEQYRREDNTLLESAAEYIGNRIRAQASEVTMRKTRATECIEYERQQLLRDGLMVLEEIERLIPSTRACLEKSGCFPYYTNDLKRAADVLYQLAGANEMLEARRRRFPRQEDT